MTESSQAGIGDPFDAEEFARQVIRALEFGDWAADALENRVLRFEEIAAARWPRRWLLRRRLARELRASVAGYSGELIPRGDFRGRRVQAVSEQLHAEETARDRRWEEFRRQRDEAGPQDGARPDEGLLP